MESIQPRFWLGLTFMCFLVSLLWDNYLLENEFIGDPPTGFAKKWHALPLMGFFAFGYIWINQFYQRHIKNLDIASIWWNGFFISLVFGMGSVLLGITINNLGATYMDDHRRLTLYLYHADLAFISAFFVNNLFLVKRLMMIKAKESHKKRFRIVEYIYLANLIFFFTDLHPFKEEWYFVLGIAQPIILVGLNFRFAWATDIAGVAKRKIILYSGILLAGSAYLSYAMILHSNQHIPVINITWTSFYFLLTSFTSLYIFTGFVMMILQNSVSSSFERKLQEANSLERFSKDIISEESAEKVLQLLVQSSVEILKISGGWVVLESENRPMAITGLDPYEVAEIQQKILDSAFDPKKPRIYPPKTIPTLLPDSSVKSLMSTPLIAKDEFLGILLLVDERPAYFEVSNQDSIELIVKQASIMVHNFLLLKNMLKMQARKHEYKVARSIHDGLLPDKVLVPSCAEVEVITHSAEEIGGDFYDSQLLKGSGKHVYVIADVSGKGTAAAYNMAQVKGIFHTLMQFDLSPDTFFEYANNALSTCFPKSSFVTATYFVINELDRTFLMSRAGHCPTLYYRASTNTCQYIDSKGLGLGIVRNSSYVKYLSIYKDKFSPGDIMVLFTDGICEARNAEGTDEYGYDRIRAFIEMNVHMNATNLAASLIQDVLLFTGKEGVDDDYTLMVYKFLEAPMPPPMSDQDRLLQENLEKNALLLEYSQHPQ